MMVGWGGNNGTTLSATILANRHNIIWHTKNGVQQPNYIGSLLRASISPVSYHALSHSTYEYNSDTHA